MLWAVFDCVGMGFWVVGSGVSLLLKVFHRTGLRVGEESPDSIGYRTS